MAASTPIVSRIAKPARRDQNALTARLAAMKASTLSRILASAERGELTDWADLCDRMILDGHVRANYETRIASIGGARWEVTPGHTGIPERDAQAGPARDFVEAVLQSCTAFEPCVMDLLDGIGVGVAVDEIDWAWQHNAWVPADLRWVHQRRFKWGRDWQLNLVDAGDGLTGAEGMPVDHWPRKFIVHTPKARSGYPGVTGCLRSVAWDWLFKRWAKQFWVQGAERFAWPFMYGEVQRGATEAVRQVMKEALDEMSADHTAVLEAGGAIKILESAIKDGGTWQGLVAALNADISKSILGSTDQTEPAKVGAWKAVESRKGTTVDSRTALDERQLAATMKRTLVTWLLELNTHRFGGVVPAVPDVRWIVADARREIPEALLRRRIVRRNEARASIGFDAIDGDIGDELIGDDETDSKSGGLSLAEVEKILAIQEKVASGAIPRDAAVELLVSAFPVDVPRAERLLGKGPEADALTSTPAADPVDPIVPGSTWIDTVDGHRIQVTSADAAKVYYIDLDSETPERQWSWARAYFIERCRPADSVTEGV